MLLCAGGCNLVWKYGYSITPCTFGGEGVSALPPPSDPHPAHTHVTQYSVLHSWGFKCNITPYVSNFCLPSVLFRNFLYANTGSISWNWQPAHLLHAAKSSLRG
jgi:hypothetical protein